MLDILSFLGLLKEDEKSLVDMIPGETMGDGYSARGDLKGES